MKKENEIEEIQGEEMTVTLDLDDGSHVNCAVVTIFTVESKDYIALMPLDENAGLSAPSSAPCLPAGCHASCHDNNGLNL